MTMQHLRRAFKASLHVMHPDIDPAEITEKLEIQPYRQGKSGPPRKPPYDLAFWMYEYDCSEVRDLVPFLEGVADGLSRHRDYLQSLIESGGSVELFCGIFMDRNWDEEFPASLLHRLGRLGVDLRLDAYPYLPVERRTSGTEKPA